MSNWVYLKNIASYDESGLSQFFSQFGPVRKILIKKPVESGQSATGYIQFKRADDARNAAASCQQIYLLWTWQEQWNTIKIENIPRGATRSDIKNLFKRYGKIINFMFKKQSAYITYEQIDNAVRAEDEMDGSMINNNSKQCVSVSCLRFDAKNHKWRFTLKYKKISIGQIVEGINTGRNRHRGIRRYKNGNNTNNTMNNTMNHGHVWQSDEYKHDEIQKEPQNHSLQSSLTELNGNNNHASDLLISDNNSIHPVHPAAIPMIDSHSGSLRNNSSVPRLNINELVLQSIHIMNITINDINRCIGTINSLKLQIDTLFSAQRQSSDVSRINVMNMNYYMNVNGSGMRNNDENNNGYR